MECKEAPFLRIAPLFEANKGGSNTRLHHIVTCDLLRRIVPKDIVALSWQDKAECFKEYKKILPLVTVSEEQKIPFNLSFFLLCQFRPNAFQFFYEVVSRWLVPGKRLNVELFFATDFRFPDLSDEIYTVAEAMVRIENQYDLEVLQKHLPIIETELRLGVASVYHARRIMEIKGLGADEKTAKIHENIASLIKRRSGNVDWDILSEMQHFLINCSDKFKAVHEYQYMSRVICFLYLFRKSLHKSIKGQEEKRHLLLKFMRVRLHLSSQVKRVLGVLVAISLKGNHEVFEERHLIRGVQNIIPQVKTVEGSFFMSHSPNESVRTLYFEIEKTDGVEFSSEEIKKLSKRLPSDLKAGVERLIHPIFMPRNEEEIMRNILTLSQQLKYVRDIPEVILSFDEQTATRLSFTVILLRILKSDSKSIQELFLNKKTFLEYFPERVKNVGFLRKKYAKEATVFHVRLDKARFLREDHSLDLYKARRAVVEELISILGEIRDFNGGMISKQNEVFLFLKELLGGVGKHHGLLLENFFYSLTPVVMRSLLEPLYLKKLFLLLLDALEDGITESNRYLLRFHQEIDSLFMVVIAKEKAFKADLIRAVDHLKSLGFESAYVNVNVQGKHAMGFIYQSQETEKQTLFYATVEEVIKSW